MSNLANFLFWFAAAFAFGFGLRKLIRAKSDWGRAGLAFLGALLATSGFIPGGQIWHLPGLIFAGGLGAMIFFGFLYLFPSGVGVHLASLRRSAK